MSAAVVTLPRPLQPAASGNATPPVQLQVRGAMARHAEVRSTPDGQAILYALVEQPHEGLPILAKQRYGAEPSSHIAAHANARALRAGTAVVLYGDELHLGQHQGQRVLELRGQTRVQLFASQAPHERSAA